MFGHNFDQLIGEDHIVVLLSGYLLGNGLQFEYLIGNYHILQDHQLELLLDETVLLLLLLFLILVQHEVECICLVEYDTQVDEVDDSTGQLEVFVEPCQTEFQFFHLLVD